LASYKTFLWFANNGQNIVEKKAKQGYFPSFLIKKGIERKSIEFGSQILEDKDFHEKKRFSPLLML